MDDGDVLARGMAQRGGQGQLMLAFDGMDMIEAQRGGQIDAGAFAHAHLDQMAQAEIGLQAGQIEVTERSHCLLSF